MNHLFRSTRLLVLFLLVLPALTSHAQEAVPATDTVVATATAHEPVPVPQPDETTMQRYRSGNVIWVVNQVMAIALPLLFLFTGWSSKLRDVATRWGRWWFFIIAIYFVLLSLAMSLFELPWAYYVEFVREHAYGLSNQTHFKWAKDTAISTLLNLVVGALIIWIPYLLLKKSPKRWWLYTGLLVLPLIILQVFITPIWISPLFNKFGPMEDKALEAKILALASRAGIEGADVFEVAKSEDTKAVNAYVTGFGDTKRIVLWDTAIDKLKEDELLFVMGHEMGHFVMGHMLRLIALSFIVTFISFYVIHRLSGILLRRYGDRWGVHALSDVASLPLIMVMMSLFTLVVMPTIFGFTRYNEHEADRFGLELTHLNHAAATGFVTLQEENLANPDPGWLFTLFRGSHPSIAQRIEFFNTYRPWESGEPIKYGHFFDSPGNDPNGEIPAPPTVTP